MFRLGSRRKRQMGSGRVSMVKVHDAPCESPGPMNVLNRTTVSDSVLKTGFPRYMSTITSLLRDSDCFGKDAWFAFIPLNVIWVTVGKMPVFTTIRKRLEDRRYRWVLTLLVFHLQTFKVLFFIQSNA